MNNQFVCDVGDFGKFGLLRSLAAQRLSLGVVWYYTTGQRTGGTLRDYLPPAHEDRYTAVDGELFHALRRINAGPRTVQGLEASGILPSTTTYFRNEVSRGYPSDPERIGWRDRAVSAVNGAEVAFFDPDNGLAADQWRMNRKKSERYAFASEARAVWNAGASLVIYHHEGASEVGRLRKLESDVEVHRNALKPLAAMRALIWSEGSRRAYLVFAQPNHVDAIDRAVSAMLGGSWGRFFSEA